VVHRRAGLADDSLRELNRQSEREHILAVLARTQFDKRKAARILGISLASLYRSLTSAESTFAFARLRKIPDLFSYSENDLRSRAVVLSKLSRPSLPLDPGTRSAECLPSSSHILGEAEEKS